MDDFQRITKAKEVFDKYLSLVREYDVAAYDLFADEAEVTSTRGNLMTISWSGKQVRELIGPSVDHSREIGRTYDISNLEYFSDGHSVVVAGHFPPTSPGQDGSFTARIGEAENGEWLFLEYHDGKPVDKAIRLNPFEVDPETGELTSTTRLGEEEL